MLTKARAISQQIVALRRELHRYPELGYQEVRTAGLVCSELAGLGIDFRAGVAKTGVIAELTRGRGRTVAVRADMDALPITEATGLPFSSCNPGVMHACGHDAHTAMLLGAARLLRDEPFSGTIRLLFQPSEEDNAGDPDGYSGARRMLVEGALQGVDSALALHQAPMLPTGTISLRDGAVLAAADHFDIIITGRSAHAGVNPQDGIDAIVIAAELVSHLQTIVSRQVSPNESAVVSIGTISGGQGYNIVADQVVLSGTTRALDDGIYQRNLQQIRTICTSLAAMHGAQIEFKLRHQVPVTRNHPAVTAAARTAARRIFPEAGLLEVPPMLGGEDFAYVTAEIPACFALLGTCPVQGQATSLHHPQMFIDETALPYGTAFLAEAALELLR